MKKSRIFIPSLTFIVLPISFLFSELKPSNPLDRPAQYSLTEGQVISIPAKKATFPLIVYGDDAGQSGTYVPSGYMGDASALEIKSSEDSVTLKSGAPGVHSLRVSYLSDKRQRSKSSGEGWVGVYWQTPANNWGKVKGAGYDLSQAIKLTFWAKGEKGGEILAEIKVGGLMGPYPDTDVSAIGPIRLSKEWKQYEINLEGKDLRHVSGGFAFSLRRADNPHGAVIYLDEVMYESKDSIAMQMPMPITALASAEGRQKHGSETTLMSPTETLLEVRKFTIPFQVQRVDVSESQKDLDDVVALAVKYAASHVVIEGHTDSVGAEQVNKKLSLERAQAVADYFYSKGIPKSRISIDGYGEDRPLVPEYSNSEEERSKNRRVEISLVPN